MTTREELEGRLRRLLAEVDDLGNATEFDGEDPGRFIRDAAALWERALKAATLQYPPTDRTLNNLTLALSLQGVSEGSTDALHALRRAANEAKHDPGLEFDTARSRDLIESTLGVPEELERAGIPEMASPARFGQKRRYVIGVYDHYTSGETEYAIWLPAFAPRKSVHPGSPTMIEIFSVRHQAEDGIKVRLQAAGAAAFRDAVDEDVVDALRDSDSEFVEAWLWEGSHRELVRAFSPDQWNLELIAGLSRADHVPSVLSAAAMAIVDVPRPAGWEDVLWKMSADFGIWRRGTVAGDLAQAATGLVGSPIDRDLFGPRWVGRDEVDSGLPSIGMDGCVLAVDEGDVVLVGLDLDARGVSLSILDEDDLKRPVDPL